MERIKKIIKVISLPLFIIVGYFVYHNAQYSKLEEKLEEFKQNKNYEKVITAFSDTLPILAQAELDVKVPRKLVSWGPIFFNLTFDKCAVLFAIETEYSDGKRIQEYYCFGDLKGTKWVFYNRLYGMAGAKMSENSATEKALKQSLKIIQDNFNIITSTLNYNDHFPNHHEKGNIPNPNE